MFLLIKFKRFSQLNTFSAISSKKLCTRFGHMAKVKSSLEPVIKQNKRLPDHLFFYRLWKKQEWFFKFSNSHWLNIFQLLYKIGFWSRFDVEYGECHCKIGLSRGTGIFPAKQIFDKQSLFSRKILPVSPVKKRISFRLTSES